jgi:hypothetical protein
MANTKLVYIYKYWAPLLNFYSEAEHIKINENLIIRVPTSFEKSLLEKYIKGQKIVDEITHLIEVQVLKDSPETIPNQFWVEGRGEIEKVITLLRLFKKDLIGYNMTIQPLAEQEEYAHVLTHLRHYTLWASEQNKLTKTKFILKTEEIETFIDFSEEYKHRLSDEFKFAIHYFNKSYIEPYTPRDSFLDLIIALENLYLKGITQELTYRLSLRASFTLGKSGREKRDIYDFFKKVYDMRSKMVHARESKNVSYDVLFEVREYTRKSLKVFLKNPKLREKDQLENLIFGIEIA